MRTQRTFLRRDLYRLVYKYSRAARKIGVDVNYAFQDCRKEYGGNGLKSLLRFRLKRTCFKDVVLKWDKSLYYLDEENKRFIKVKETNHETGFRHTKS